MTSRLLFAGILGAVAMFVWSAIAHMFLPLGEIGLSEIPSERSVMSALDTALQSKAGLYVFPGAELGLNPTSAEKKEAMSRIAQDYEKKASGILIYNPPGRPYTFGRWLATEFVTELIESLLVVYLLSKTRLSSFGARVGFFIGAGFLVAIGTNVSYWNWFGFPLSYTLAYITMQLVSFIFAGLGAALLLRKTTFD